MTKRINAALLCAIFVLFLLLCTPGLVAHANSAQTSWSGRDSFGAYVTDKNCPVEVESEKLTLRVPHFPSNYYNSLEEFESYEANVTAEYAFHNPADYDVEMTLAFPFGKMPDYFYSYWDDESQSYCDFDDTARYAITADKEEVSRTLRYTLNSWKFDPKIDVARLSDDKRSSGFISPDTPVTIYTYNFYPEKTDYATCVAANFYGLGDSDKTCVMLQQFSIADYGKNTEMCGTWLTDNSTLKMYVIGQPLKKMPEWKIYKNGALRRKIAGRVELSPEPTTVTFNELALMYYEEGEVGEVDWYNAALDRLCEGIEKGKIVATHDPYSLNVSYDLMRWYEYGLSIPAGGRVVNSVTAPLYPNINLGWEPAKYSYTYLLSPASTWAEFGSFEVEIQTPYYVVGSSLNFEKGEDVYTYSRQGLPEGELTFTLCSSASPKYTRQPFGRSFGYFMLFIGLPIILIVFFIAVIIAAIVLPIVLTSGRKKQIKKL